MAKTLSPVKRSGHGSSSSSSGAATSQTSGAGGREGSLSGGNSSDDSQQLTVRTERVESTIVSRENATHAAFAASRTSDFVYAASSHYLHLLNDYCNNSNTTTSSSSSSESSNAKSLLVVVGQPGMGKSALLAHWAAQRRASEDGANEFIYEHYCGCSYDSVKLSLFLFRLMNQLKLTYALRDFELPREHDEEKLKFSFARCLEAAVGRTNQRAGSNASAAAAPGATKGGGRGASSSRRIVLVLDGIDCLRTEDGGDSLSWLPNSFPDGVRIIVSATHGVKSSQSTTNSSTGLQSASTVVRKPVAYDGDGDLIYDTTLPPASGDIQDSHTIRELRRRRPSFVVVEPLDETACRGVLQLYNSSSRSKSTSPHESKSQLSESEQNAMVSAPGSSSPLYLRLVLQGQELFGSDTDSGSGSAGGTAQVNARHAWLDRVTSTGELHVVYELLMRRWTDLLLVDLEEQQHRLLHPATTTDGPGKLTRRATKRDVAADAHHSQSHGEAATNQSQSQSQRPSLLHTPSMRSGNAHAATTASAVDPVEWEALQTAMEQRVLLARHTLSLLAVSRYGLSETDLQRLLGDAVPKPITHKLLQLLQPHVMRIRRRDCGGDDSGGSGVVLLDLSHNQLRLLVRYGFLRDDHLRGCYYKELATYFSGLEASQRRLDELPVQLERCAMWSTLQAALVDIKMFQLWWSERNRQELFSYWTVLRTNCSIHDPVDDFVRSLDEYIIHESPSAEQLLALCLTITDFLRTWQRIDDSRSSSLALARPAPPQLNEFVASLGGVSQAATAQQSEHDARRVASEIDALCLHKSDAYFVRRWLWTQFPLLGVAFESRFLRTLRTFSPSTAQTQTHAGGVHDYVVGDHGSKGKKKTPTQTTVLPKSLQGNTATKSSSGAVVVPIKRTKPSLLVHDTTAKDRELHSTDTTPASAATTPTTTTDDGAFEFLSTENTELTVGSVSKFESQVVELRSKYDKLKFLAKERQAALKTLDSRLLDARAQARQADQSASQVDDLLDQIRQIQDETVLGRQRSDYYKAILRHCEIHPARDPNAIEVTETAVNKMKHEIVELQQKTQVASYEARLAAVENKKFQQVIDEKTMIHNTALERLRWRWELLQRMLQQQSPHAEDSDANSAELLAWSDDDDGDDDNDDGGGEEENSLVDDNNNNTGGDQGGGGGGGGGAHGRRRSRMTRKPSATEIEFNRAKDKLLHKKETSLERLRKVDQLKVYVGSPYKDDGVLGALRQVGINKPEEAHLYWQDQQQHAVQLEAEERNLELRVVEYRERLASLQSQLVNLKLGGSAGYDNNTQSSEASVGTTSGSAPATVSTTTAAATVMCANATAPSEPPLTAGATTTATTTSASQHNLKQLEQHVGDALTIAQQKRERAARLKALSERLNLGLQHVAHIVGVCVTPQMESMELADAVEQVVRLYLGDEGHSQSTASTNLRRKNSVRAAMGLASQSGLHTTVVAPDTRTNEEKRRYNIRVSKSPQRQMNPYVDGDRVKMRGGQEGGGDKEEEEEEEDDDDEEEEDGGQEEGGEEPGEDGGASNERNRDSVTRRADIKNRSRREVDRKLKSLAAKQDKTVTGKTGKAGSTKRQSVVQ